MILTVIGVLVFAALIGVLLHISRADRCPIWFPVLLLCLVELIRLYPLGR